MIDDREDSEMTGQDSGGNASAPLPDATGLPTLETDRLRLRRLTPGDVAALYEIFGDREVCRYWSHSALADMDEARALQEQIEEFFRQRSLFQWGIEERATGGIAGTCSLAQLSVQHQRAEIGFALARRGWGRGYMREVLPVLLTFAFDELGLNRIEADVDPRNIRSLRLLEDLGFEREGYQRERYHVHGETQDSVLLALLRARWEARAT